MRKRRAKKQLIGALAVIFNDSHEILLTRRHQPDTPYHGKWQLPGGGVEFGEDPIETVAREVEEEVGITITLLSDAPIVHSILRDYDPDFHLILLSYPAKYLSGDIDTRADPETDVAKWFLPEKIETLDALEPTREIIERALKYLL